MEVGGREKWGARQGDAAYPSRSPPSTCLLLTAQPAGELTSVFTPLIQSPSKSPASQLMRLWEDILNSYTTMLKMSIQSKFELQILRMISA